MREILFRGKRIDNGEWVEGDFVHPCNIVFESIGYDEVLKQDNVPIGNDYEVIPETVGEYTGLTDKNGKKIFEGDILTCGNRFPYSVTFENGRFKIEDKYESAIKTTQEAVSWFEMKVIGNIYDNPELLKENE